MIYCDRNKLLIFIHCCCILTVILNILFYFPNFTHKVKKAGIYIVLFPEQKNISLTGINKYLFIMEMSYVFCEVVTEFFNIIFLIILVFKGTVGLPTPKLVVYISLNNNQLMHSQFNIY